MVDLKVDTEAIRRGQSTFGDIRDRLESAVSGFPSVSGSSVAHPQLRDRAERRGGGLRGGRRGARHRVPGSHPPDERLAAEEN